MGGMGAGKKKTLTLAAMKQRKAAAIAGGKIRSAKAKGLNHEKAMP